MDTARYWPSMRKQPPMIKKIPAMMMKKLLQPHPAQGP
jgi:hypothetical protein